jgi:predicted nucleic acid-binding protein
MNIILDACTIINLINGQSFHSVISIPGLSIFVGDNLIDQEISLNIAQKIIIESAVNENKITLLLSNVTLADFSTLKAIYELGNGETECIALCKLLGYHIATDDWKARSAATVEIGVSKVIGSLFLLREAVRKKILTCTEAQNSFLLMKKKGGFLPNIDLEYFCK